MRSRILTSLLVVHALACSLSAQTNTVFKDKNNRLLESLKVPSGKTLTIESGATINATGATITGFTASSAWADITGTPANVTAFGSLSNAAGLLTNNGSGTLSYTGTSADGGIFDSGKAVLYRSSGGIRAGSFQLGTNTIANPFAAGLTWTMPTTNGNLVCTGDTATVTNAMLAGSIALTKLALTGTPDGTKFIRDDGSYQAINLSGYLPLTGGTLTGPLTLTGGTVTTSTPMLTQSQTWNASGVTFRGVDITFTETASATGSTYLRILGGAAGSTARLSVGTDKTVISGAEAGGRVLDLTSVAGTAYFTVTGGGALFINGAAYFTGGEVRGAQSGNSSNYLGILYDAGSSLACIRPSTTTLQIGAGAASPIAYTLRGASARAGTDTNTSGASFTLAGGNGTGTGGGGQLIFQTAPTGSSGSAANTLTTRMTIKRDGVINMSGMPTSSAGLSSGDLWNDSGTVKIVP